MVRAVRGHGDSVDYTSDKDAIAVATARIAIAEDQRPQVDDVLFAKTYFALEETGIGYPTLSARAGDGVDRLDGYLRVFADSYRVRGNRWVEQDFKKLEWTEGRSVSARRLKEFAAANRPGGQI
ncbi:hypothetical protein [Acuticoccus sp.]|uniref:hypothetical protein n=1 Tax=Acuticoccus sp. TaxID=1904378 RepID=UPI003B5165E0